MAANSLKNTRVKVGQSLSIVNSENVSDSPARTSRSNSSNTSNKAISKKKIYMVKRGDTLHSIAEKFDVTLVEIKRWNKNISSDIQPGDKLTIMQSRPA